MLSSDDSCATIAKNYTIADYSDRGTGGTRFSFIVNFED